MEERNYGINWIALFIKVIVFVIVVLLAIWLISKITLKDKGLSFDENNKLFTSATIEYFKNNLPKKGDNLTVTLKQLINGDYIEELKDEDGKVCNNNKSTSKIEVVEDYYSIKSVFVCGNKSETTYIKLGNENCTDCDAKVEGLKIDSKEEKNEDKNTSTDISQSSSTTNNSSNQNTTNNNSTKPNQTILYEYVKESIEYSDWYIGKVTGENIENSTKNVLYSKYAKNESYTYRTASYVTKAQNFTYTLELINLNDKIVSSVKLESDNYFIKYQDYQEYLNYAKKSLSMVGVNEEASFTIPDANTLRKASLDSDNFTFGVSDVYKKNNRYYVDLTVKVKNINGVNPYYASKIKSNVYFVPIKFTVSYVNETNYITDKTENSNKYNNYTIVDTWIDRVDIYRYKTTIIEYKYSNATSLEGYKKTGNTKLAS